MSGQGQAVFEAAKYLTRVNGNDYLEVKWRLVWLRDRHPDAQLVTELVSHVDGVALFRASVRVPGGGLATGWGSESAGDFRDYLEKAETKAIGRALAALGFGTQFCADNERGHETPESDAAPAGQLAYLHNVAAKAGLSDDELEERAFREFGVPVHGLSRHDASYLATLIRGDTTEGMPPTGLSRLRRLEPVAERRAGNGW